MSPALETERESGTLTGMDSQFPSRPDARATALLSPAATGTPSLPLQSQSDTSIPGTASCEASLCTWSRTEAADPLLPAAQRRWAARALPDRLAIVRSARHWIATHPQAFARAISPALARAEADTLTTELLPLLEAMRFLERKARKLLAPRKLGLSGRPLWLAGVEAEIHRDPLGHVLVIGPANFPLFLPGVQALQALVAGNAVTWKPGAGGEDVALLFAHVLRQAGLPRGVLHVTDTSVTAAQDALAQGPDKVVFTGSFRTGQHILRELAETATPATLELSGADAVIVLPSADLALAARAVAFGLRLNGGEVCMSPRRLVATPETMSGLRPLLQAEFAKAPVLPLKPQTAAMLTPLLRDALAAGAGPLSIEPDAGRLDADHTVSRLLSAGRPMVLDRVTPEMAVARSDVFAPVLSLLEAPSVLHMADLVNNNPYGLTAAIFGAPAEAQVLAEELRTGTVLINDLIAPTADPRVPFGGRRHSGYGLTRGAEGLLEMTAVKTILRRRKGLTRHYDPLGSADLPLFAGLVGVLHGGTLGDRWRALRQVVAAGRARTR